MALTDIFNEDKLETGAPDIKYEGDLRPEPKEEPMLMAGPDWYQKRLEILMDMGYDYDEAGDIAFDSSKYYEIVGDSDMDGGYEPGDSYAYGGPVRQAYGLGSIVKKLKRGVKKIVKSPVGKAALLGLGSYFAAPYVSGAFKPNKKLAKFFLRKPEAGFTLKNIMDSGLTGKGLATLIGGSSALSGLMAGRQEEEDEDLDTYLADRGDPYFENLLARLGRDRFTLPAEYRLGAAEGGLMKLKMGGLPAEMDFRAEGGFVPIGKKEKADDVPARLSKNEFVMTADAVRNAGEGDIDLGAERMYNVMRNLENGGTLSEESQGLEGARNMFQTSQRLGDIL